MTIWKVAVDAKTLMRDAPMAVEIADAGERGAALLARDGRAVCRGAGAGAVGGARFAGAICARLGTRAACARRTAPLDDVVDGGGERSRHLSVGHGNRHGLRALPLQQTLQFALHVPAPAAARARRGRPAPRHAHPAIRFLHHPHCTRATDGNRKHTVTQVTHTHTHTQTYSQKIRLYQTRTRPMPYD